MTRCYAGECAKRPFKRELIQQARISPGQQVLDIGCGTGTLTVLVKQTHPAAEVVGLDGDPNVLAIARAKASKAGVDIRWDHGMAFELPYADRSFDRALTSLVLHHLTTENKQRALRETWRVLQPGGELLVLDFGKPGSLYGRLLAFLGQRLEEVADNIKGLLPNMLRGAGFDPVNQQTRYTTIVGDLWLIRGHKP